MANYKPYFLFPFWGAVVATGTGTGGTPTIATLTAGDKPKPAGTYTAANLANHVTGNGCLVVMSGPPAGTLMLLR